MEYILIGKIVSAVGLKGEVKVYNYSERERYEDLEFIHLFSDGDFEKRTIQQVRYQKNMIILKLEGIDDRSKAESLKDVKLFIAESELKELPEDTFYIRDLKGMSVFDIEEDLKIGEVTDVIQNSAQDLYQITTSTGKTVLLPAVGEFIKEINLEEKLMKVKLIPGFIEKGREG